METKIKNEYKTQICNDCGQPTVTLCSMTGMDRWVCKECFKEYKKEVKE